MTAEALSPPNPMQLLRERLIKEGSIVSGASIEKLKDKLNKKIIQVIDVESIFNNEIGKYYNAISVICGRAIDFASEYESESLGEKPKHIWILRLSLLINKFYKFINSLFLNLRTNTQRTPFARCGFYSPLKENMKNAP